MKKISAAIFVGDSFTWGEGLQLYIDNEYWKSQRNVENTWLILKDKCTIESELFREKNRFAGLVSDELKLLPITYKDAGVLIKDTVKLIENNLYRNDIDVKFIIYQFTILDRLPIHFDLECKCNCCSKNKTISDLLFNYINSFINKEYNIENKKEFEEFLKEKNLEFNLDNFDEYSIDEIKKLFYKKLSHLLLKEFVEKYINKWKKKVPIYFISSWFGDTNEILKEFDVIQNNLIKLIGYDYKFYNDYDEWQKTFKFEHIGDEFKKTNNQHPTLQQHQYISKSIINHLKKNEIKL